jgi:hypothetical protein
MYDLNPEVKAPVDVPLVNTYLAEKNMTIHGIYEEYQQSEMNKKIKFKRKLANGSLKENQTLKNIGEPNRLVLVVSNSPCKGEKNC